jgi:long-chain acyl-CoA synthetase
VTANDQTAETLVDRLFRHGHERADSCALQDPSGSMTWRELDTKTNRIANALINAGLRRASRVALLADTDIQTAALILGVLKAGASAVPLPALIGADAIARVVVDSGAEVFFVSSNLRKHVTSELAASPIRRVSIDFTGSEWMSLEAFLGSANDEAPQVRVYPHDEFNIIYSSGTTGRPKGIIHDHALRARAAVTLGAIAFPPGVRTLTATALYSNYTMGALIYTLWAGGCVRFLGKFSVPALLQVAREFCPNNVYLVPVQIGQFLEYPEVKAGVELPAAIKWSAGSYLSQEWKRAIMDRWPGGLLELYGMSEGAPATLLVAHDRPDKLHTVGRASPPEDVKVIDENDVECPIGVRGEIVGRIRSVMKGYNNDEAATAALRWYDSEGTAYFRSGDIGVLDDERFLQVTDRKKDMIISGGFNIYASDIEELLLSHPAIAEAAAFAVPSEKWGESPAAVVVLKAGHEESGDILRSWANSRLGRLQRLAAIAIAEALPRGALDKVLKRELRAMYVDLGDDLKR